MKNIIAIINELNITEAQKSNTIGWLKVTKNKKVSLHKDDRGNLYQTGYHDDWKRNVTHRIYPCGLWDSRGNNIRLSKYELLYQFKEELSL